MSPPDRASGRVPGPGRRVLVTRPADQAASWVAMLRERGIEAAALPLLGIGPAADPASVDAAWRDIASQALLVFVSPNAASRFFERRPPGAAWPPEVHAASPGPGTSDILRRLGVAADRLIEPAADAAQFDSESLWLQLGQKDWAGRQVLIVRGEGGREWLADQLRAAGAHVEAVAAYRRGAPQLDAIEQALLRQALAAPTHHLWLFSSSEAIDHLSDAAAALQAAGDGLAQALRRSTALATHPRIAERAAAAGFGQVTPCRPELDAVVACIQSAPAPLPCGEPHASP